LGQGGARKKPNPAVEKTDSGGQAVVRAIRAAGKNAGRKKKSGGMGGAPTGGREGTFTDKYSPSRGMEQVSMKKRPQKPKHKWKETEGMERVVDLLRKLKPIRGGMGIKSILISQHLKVGMVLKSTNTQQN